MADTAVFDVDGTLVDTNYQHALAWYRAFRSHGIVLPLWRIHRSIGMGGDQIVEELAGPAAEASYGDELREAWQEFYDPMLAEVQPLEGASELLKEVKSRGFRLVLASSGQAQQVAHYLELLDGKALADAWTTSDDVEQTKPAPDLVAVAVGRVEGADAVMVGDSTWDFVAAGKLSVPGIAVQTGGFSPEELREAGAGRVFSSLVELREQLDDTLLARPS